MPLGGTTRKGLVDPLPPRRSPRRQSPFPRLLNRRLDSGEVFIECLEVQGEEGPADACLPCMREANWAALGPLHLPSKSRPHAPGQKAPASASAHAA